MKFLLPIVLISLMLKSASAQEPSDNNHLKKSGALLCGASAAFLLSGTFAYVAYATENTKVHIGTGTAAGLGGFFLLGAGLQMLTASKKFNNGNTLRFGTNGTGATVSLRF